jgi:ribosomal protein L3
MTTAEHGHRLGLLGRKVGMMRIYTDDGDAIPVTVLDVSNNRVTQIKTPESDGYTHAYCFAVSRYILTPPAGFPFGWQAAGQPSFKLSETGFGGKKTGEISNAGIDI